MITDLFLKGRGRDELPAAELAALEAAIEDIVDIPANTLIVQAGEPVIYSTYLIKGFVCRYMDDRAGHRQLVATHVPGDFFDLHGFPMRYLDHDVASLGPVTVARFTHDRLVELTQDWPHLTRKLWFSTLLDAAIHREWIFRLGRLEAEGRVAHFFLELGARLALVGVADEDQYQTPLTQIDVAEACGITAVHTNRTLRQLREKGLLWLRGGEVTIVDRVGLIKLAEFDPAYLYVKPTKD